ncbi:hypothetical protein F5B19DRAFT_494922 [Rostrohypoxylon terebratum]|nr:hypothetical protein F5B19DRAFT_494922 [Rostrohypoxylon terebratum]
MFGIIKSPDEMSYAEATLKSESSGNDFSPPYSKSTSLISSTPEAHGTPNETKVNGESLLSDRPISNQKPQSFLVLTSGITSTALQPQPKPQDSEMELTSEPGQEPQIQVHCGRSSNKPQPSFLQHDSEKLGRSRQSLRERGSEASVKPQTSSKTVALRSKDAPEPGLSIKAQNQECSERNTDGTFEMSESSRLSVTSHQQDTWTNPYSIYQNQQYNPSYLSPDLPPQLLYAPYTSDGRQQLMQPYPYWQGYAGPEQEHYNNPPNQSYYELVSNADVSPLLISSPRVYPHAPIPVHSSLVDPGLSSLRSSASVKSTEHPESSELFKYPAYQMPRAESFQTQEEVGLLRSRVAESSTEFLRDPRIGRSPGRSPRGGDYSRRTSQHRTIEQSEKSNRQNDANGQHNDNIQENANLKTNNSKVRSDATVGAGNTEGPRDGEEVEARDEKEVSSGSVVEFKARRTVRDQEQVEEFEFKFVFKK